MNLRFPAELKQQIEDAAKANNRSMNAEIVSRLEASFGAKAADEWSDKSIYASLSKAIHSVDTSNYEPGSTLRAAIATLLRREMDRAFMEVMADVPSGDQKDSSPKSSILFGQEAEPAKPIPKPTYPKPKR